MCQPTCFLLGVALAGCQQHQQSWPDFADDAATRGVIYGYGGGLLTYDRLTGAATQVGESFEITGTGGIAFDDANQRIVVYDTKINQFYAFEPDGTPSTLAGTSTFWSNALAYTGETFVMSRSFYSGDGENQDKVLLSVDPDTGEVLPWLDRRNLPVGIRSFVWPLIRMSVPNVLFRVCILEAVFTGSPTIA